MGGLTLILLSIAAGFWLGSIWDSYAIGFLAIGGVYFLMALVIFFFKKQLITVPVLNLTLDACF